MGGEAPRREGGDRERDKGGGEVADVGACRREGSTVPNTRLETRTCCTRSARTVWADDVKHDRHEQHDKLMNACVILN